MTLGAFAWVSRASVAAQLLARQLGVPVTIHSLEVYSQGADISRLWIGNPPDSHTSTSFSAESFQVRTTLPQLMADPLVIDEIVVSDIFIELEYYDSSKKKSNWATILGEPSKRAATPSRDYLIRTLRLEKMNIEVTHANGSKQTYTLPRMEFHNISSETGFPIGEIEKAIFQQVLQNLIQQFHLDQLFNSGVIPIPKGIPLPFLP